MPRASNSKKNIEKEQGGNYTSEFQNLDIKLHKTRECSFGIG